MLLLYWLHFIWLSWFLTTWLWYNQIVLMWLKQALTLEKRVSHSNVYSIIFHKFLRVWLSLLQTNLADWVWLAGTVFSVESILLLVWIIERCLLFDYLQLIWGELCMLGRFVWTWVILWIVLFSNLAVRAMPICIVVRLLKLIDFWKVFH